MNGVDDLRLMARVARMYYEWEMSQASIARQLGLSQATVSRLLGRAREEGIVRIAVHVPEGVFAELEETLVRKFSLRDAIVVDSLRDDEPAIQRDIGAAAAYYLEATVQANELIGISSWSGTLLAMVDALHPLPRKPGVRVVQLLGGVGNPAAEIHATHLTSRLATLVGGEPIFLPAPGVVGSAAARDVLLADEYVRATMALFDEVTTALVGIGAVDPSPLLSQSGNAYSRAELDGLQAQGAVGDILLHFYDAHGRPVDSDLARRVIAMRLEQLRRTERAIGLAGGKRKFASILGALRSGWINILITDQFTAGRLAKA